MAREPSTAVRGPVTGGFAPGEVERARALGLPPLPRTGYDALLRRAEARFGADHVLFEFPDSGERLTVAALRVDADRAAAALLAMGLVAGDTVAVWSPAAPAWPVLMFGAARVGVRVCGVNTRYRSQELRHVVATTRPQLAVVTTGFLDIDSVGLVTGAGLARDRVITTSAGAVDGELATFLDSGRSVDADAVAARAAAVPVDAGALVQFTSGSTGAPKAVLLSQSGSVAAAHYGAAAVGLGPDDVLYSPLPFFHIGGTISTALAAVASGCCAVLPQRFDAAAALRTMAQRGCTAFHGHGALWRILLDEHRTRPVPLPQLHKGWASGDVAFLTAVHDELGVAGLVNMYGSSESGTIACTDPTDPPEVRLGALGRPTPGTVASVRDTDGNEVPDGKVGELWLRGTMSMLGYLDTDGAPVPPPDGWVRTGDLVCTDVDGLLHLRGRADDRLKPGGENVSVAEVEEFLRGDDCIEEAVVVGIPDHRLGDVPAAVVRLTTGAVTDEAAIIARCRQHIAAFKVPRRVRIVDALPTLDTGKIDRRRVRVELLEHLEPR